MHGRAGGVRRRPGTDRVMRLTDARDENITTYNSISTGMPCSSSTSITPTWVKPPARRLSA
jgi:hypothetical protein